MYLSQMTDFYRIYVFIFKGFGWQSSVMTGGGGGESGMLLRTEINSYK